LGSSERLVCIAQRGTGFSRASFGNLGGAIFASDSTASSHANHADIQAHNSKGPAIPDSMPKAESKEDLKKRAEELNK
jgi:hypothetical protein